MTLNVEYVTVFHLKKISKLCYLLNDKMKVCVLILLLSHVKSLNLKTLKQKLIQLLIGEMKYYI